MDLTASGFNNEQPDGYQVIDPTTGDVLGFPEDTILTYSLAKGVQQKYANRGALILPVTEDEVNSRLDEHNRAGYAPGFLTFSGAIYRKHEPIPPNVRLDTTGGKACFPPNIVRAIMSAAGLPVPLDPMQAQYRWPIKLAHERIYQLLTVGIQDGPLHDAVIELQALMNELYYEFKADLLVLDFNGFLK